MKRDNNKAEAKKVGTIVADDAPTFLESIMEEVLGPPAIKLEVGDPTKEMQATPPTPLDIEVVEMALAIIPLALPTVIEEEVQRSTSQYLHY